jgi:carbon starvation protein CstA
VAVILVWAKMSPGGFTILWRYFAWSNQTIAIFAFAMITIYLLGKGHPLACFMSLIPGAWYAFVTFTYICNAPIGFNIPMNLSYGLGVLFAMIYAYLVYRRGVSVRKKNLPLEAKASY